jgi:benzoate/toluate 1,2-dioxygenase reductase subunit
MADYKVALSFEDGVTRFIRVKPNQTIANASYQQKINIPVDCNDGACGTCKCFNESGEFDMPENTYVEDALSPAEREEGYLLTCQAKPTSDMVIQVPTSSSVAKTQSANYTATVTEIHKFPGDLVVRLKVKIPNRSDLAFLPGQYVNITVPGSEDTRAYSFSSGPDDEELEFQIKIVPGGLMSTWLADKAKVGDTFEFNGPHGSFFLREAMRPVLLVAGGTGLAPIMSMLRHVEATGSARVFHLVYGANTDNDIVETDLLDRWAKELPNFSWDYCVADPNAQAKNKGFVMGIIEPEHLHAGDASIYLCGPPPMVEAVREHVKGIGVEPNGFFYEKFTSSTPAKTAVDVAATGESAVPALAPEETVRKVAARMVRGAKRDLILAGEGGRAIMGQEMFDSAEIGAAPGGAPAVAAPGLVRSIMGQLILVDEGETAGTVEADMSIAPAQATRTIMGQEIFAESDIESLAGSQISGIAATFLEEETDEYEIGEEHPAIQKSDAIFEARQALELGAIELVLGRLNSQQIAAYRMLAEATIPYVKGDQFTDPLGFTETNAAFHDYLFSMTNNQHLLQAYQRLGVKGEMEEVLKNAHWCHPLIAKDHLDMVDAIEAGDRQRARDLFIAHADRSKQTMRRAMRDAQATPFVSPGRFAGKVVVITGAAQGIGEAVARRIHAEGGKLVLADRSELVEGVANKLAETGSEAISTLVDLETMAGAQQVVDAAIAKFGRIDVAIHVVGGTIWRKPFEEYAEDEIVKEVNRSLYPTMWSCRAVLPHLYERGRGTIVNVSSVATTGLNRLPYAAAKGGVNALTRSLAWEAAEHGVRVVATAPGGTDAPPRKIQRGGEPQNQAEEAWHQTTVDQTIESSLLKRYGSLDEQAAAICFLASDEASYITGTTLPVAGGDLG